MNGDELPIFLALDHGEQVPWELTDKQYAKLREDFPTVQVREVLYKAAEWTQRNRSRLKQSRNMLSWLRKVWLTRAAGELDHASKYHGAQRELSKTPWERRGMTEEEWKQEQDDKYHRRTQQQLDLHKPKPLPLAARRALEEVKGELAVQIACDEEEAPARTLLPAYCLHRNWQDHQTQCPDCGMWRHQYEEQVNFAFERGVNNATSTQ